MPTNRRKKTRNILREPLPDFVRILLMDGSEACHSAMLAYNHNTPNDRKMTGAFEAFMMRKDDAHMQAGIAKYKEEIGRLRAKKKSKNE